MRLLIPDAQFEGSPDVEQAAGPDDLTIEVFRGRRMQDIPEESWRRCEAIVVWHVMAISPEVVALLDNCRIVARAGIGVDRINIEACAARGIPVCNCPDYGITDVADHAIALSLSLLRGITYFQDALRNDPVASWRWNAPPLITRVRGKRFGIVGLGRIGTATARRAQALDMQVAFYDPYVAAGQEQAVAAERLDSLEALLKSCDVISLHAPHTAETDRMIDATTLAQMKEGAVLINTARGGLVDLDALHAALKEGRLSGAGIDVLPEEPPDPMHPLLRAYAAREDWLAGRFVLTPHAAFYSEASFADLRRKPVETALAYMSGNELRNCVNVVLLRAAGHDPKALSDDRRSPATS